MTHEKEVTDRARREAQKALDEAAARVRSETESARAQLMPQADALAKQIAGKLLGREMS
jgi:F0F1-type ATP synthase membrane subunit b/b'